MTWCNHCRPDMVSTNNQAIEISKILETVVTNKFAIGHLDVYRNQLLTLQEKAVEEKVREALQGILEYHRNVKKCTIPDTFCSVHRGHDIKPYLEFLLNKHKGEE